MIRLPECQGETGRLPVEVKYVTVSEREKRDRERERRQSSNISSSKDCGRREGREGGATCSACVRVSMAASVRACWVREQRRRSQGAVATAAATAASRRPPQSCCKQVPPAFCTPFLPGIGGATWYTYALPARCRVPEG